MHLKIFIEKCISRGDRMLRKIGMLVVVSIMFSGCAGVPMEDVEKSSTAKKFNAPSERKSGLYIYRNSFVGQALKKDVWIDGKCIGETAPEVFFYEEVDGDKKYTISTESTYSSNDLVVNVKSGMNYFIRQYIRLGILAVGVPLGGGAGVERVMIESGV